MTKPKPLPDQAFLHQCFTYNPVTGELWWKERPPETFVAGSKRTAQHIAKVFNTRFAGEKAFTAIAANGYLKGAINGDTFYAHRIIWKMVHGTDPDDIDHDDGDRANNRQKNLVDRNRTGNMRNRKLSRNNTTGHHGVSYSKIHKLWTARIYANNRPVHLGWFRTKEEAVAARSAAEKLHGYNPNHGRS